MRLSLRRPKRLQLSVVVPKELGEGSFAQMLPTLDDYDPASLTGWIEWERANFWGRLGKIRSWVFGGDHNNFETLLSQLGLSSADMKALKPFILSYYSDPEQAPALREVILAQLDQVKQEIASMKEEREVKSREAEAAQKAILVAKIALTETVQTADGRMKEIDRVLALRRRTVASYERQLNLLPHAVSLSAGKEQKLEGDTAEATA